MRGSLLELSLKERLRWWWVGGVKAGVTAGCAQERIAWCGAVRARKGRGLDVSKGHRMAGVNGIWHVEITFDLRA
jgi:hypothetical protein